MATIYISWDTGDDTTGDGSLLTPWKSFTKALGAAGASSGDIIIAAPGIYRETLTIDLAPAAETIVRGDPLNASGFAGVSKGPVVLSGYTTDDITAYAGSVNITATSKDHFTFENLWFIGRGQNIYLTTCENWTIRGCLLHTVSNNSAIVIIPAVDTAANITIDQCVIEAIDGVYVINAPTSDSADYDLNILVKNCLIRGSALNTGVAISATGTGAYFAGGLDVLNCTIFARYGVRTVTASKLSTSIQCTVYNCVISADIGVIAATSGQIKEDYNLFLNKDARSNVSVPDAGVNSKTTAAAPYLEFGQSWLWGLPPKAPCAPWSLSRTLGFGGSSPPTTDLFGLPRPSGSGAIVGNASAGIGAIECHDFGEQVTFDSASAIRMTGPGDHELLIAVTDAATTLSIDVQYDNAGDNDYGGTNYPQAILLDMEAFAGISGNTETETATTDAAGDWQTLTFTEFTPSRKGVVRLRLVSRDSNGDGYVYWRKTP